MQQQKPHQCGWLLKAVGFAGFPATEKPVIFFMAKKEDKDKIISDLRTQIIELTKAAGKLALENQDLKAKIKKSKSHK